MTMNKIHIELLTAIAITGWLAFAWAESDPALEEQKELPTEEKVQAPLNTPSKSQQTLPEFTPSEEVSIDKPVAFPVDI